MYQFSLKVRPNILPGAKGTRIASRETYLVDKTQKQAQSSTNEHQQGTNPARLSFVTTYGAHFERRTYLTVGARIRIHVPAAGVDGRVRARVRMNACTSPNEFVCGRPMRARACAGLRARAYACRSRREQVKARPLKLARRIGRVCACVERVRACTGIHSRIAGAHAILLEEFMLMRTRGRGHARAGGTKSSSKMVLHQYPAVPDNIRYDTYRGQNPAGHEISFQAVMLCVIVWTCTRILVRIRACGVAWAASACAARGVERAACACVGIYA
eukprot:4337994-Pleurochrysis_carterae.AAC.2